MSMRKRLLLFGVLMLCLLLLGGLIAYRVATRPIVRVVHRTIVYQVAGSISRDGMLTDAQCKKLARQAPTLQLLMQEVGYAKEEGPGSGTYDSSQFDYPIRTDQNRYCTVNFNNGPRANVSLDLPGLGSDN